MSIHESAGLHISAFRPEIDTSVPSYIANAYLLDDNLSEKAIAYSHEIRARGGFWSASLTLSGSLVWLEDWFDSGVGRHIEVYGPSLMLVWEGFVNTVQLTAGTLSASRGPLMDVANRVNVTYTPILDATTFPPITGTETTSAAQNDATSQAKYGILQEIVSGGRLLDDGTNNEAERLRDTTLEERKEPEMSEEISLGGSDAPSVTLELLGYVHFLMKYVVETITTATATITTKLQDCLGDDPNGLFSTDYSAMAANGFLVSRYEYENRTAWAIIESLVALGDAADSPYTFGIYADRRAYYAAFPTVTEYQHRIAGQEMQVEGFGMGTEIKPWDVRPAKWMFLVDFLAGRSAPSDYRVDPRYLFIESVRYGAPRNLDITGQKVGSLAQVIAQLSMGST